jgi:hypothetical protein
MTTEPEKNDTQISELENDPQLRLKLLQVEQSAEADSPDSRRGMRAAPCGCLFFGALGLPLLKLGCNWKTFAIIILFAVIGAVLTGIAAAYRPGRR